MRDVFFPAAVAGRNSASGMKLVMFYRSSLLQNSLGSCGVHHRLFDCLLLNMSLSMLMRYFQAVPTCHILLGLLLSSILSFQSLPATLRRQGTKRGSAGGLRLPVPQPVERMRIRGTSEPRWLKGLLIFTYKSPSVVCTLYPILSPSHVVFGGHGYLRTWLGLSWLWWNPCIILSEKKKKTE